jgi:SAM-dependent methyltransferase
VPTPQPSTRGRAVRVVRALASPDTRPATVRKLVGRTRDAVSPHSYAPRCRVCRSHRTHRVRTTFAQPPEKSFLVHVCKACGYVHNPDNFNDYTQYESVKQFPKTARVGSDAKPGREFHMGAMAVEIMGRRHQSVLVVGPGASVDFRHIEALPNVDHVAIGDLVQLHEGRDFVDMTAPPQRQFDVLVASEVIEHYVDPLAEFRRLFQLVNRDGLVVCSTNVYDGGNLNRHKYLFIKGHTSYYSPAAIARIARVNGMLFDFRLPQVSHRLGPRKRYVLFSRSADRMQDVARYFGQHAYAPSED